MNNNHIREPNEVLDEIKEILVIDLVDHSLSVETKYSDMLVDPIEGLYLAGSLHPILDFSKDYKYYPKSFFRHDSKRIINYVMAMQCNEDIVDYNGEIILTYSDKVKKRRFLHKKPSIPVSTIMASLTIADNFLSSICEFSKIQYVHLDLKSLVKPQFHDLIGEYEFEKAYKNLTNKIALFVGNDTWNIYFCRLRGCSLIIQKSIDWRIYRYYQMIYEQNELSMN